MSNYSNSFFLRCFDVIVATTFIILFLPLYFIIFILLKIQDVKEPALLLSPYRVMKNGKLFRMYKFRYMIPNAHERMKKGEFGKDLKEKWEKNGGKLNFYEDPRITKVGKVLRVTDLDEIPQMFNVIKGDMSIVGPRPYFMEEIERYKKQFPHLSECFKYILSVKPGITGLWQVSGRNSLPLEDRIKLDAECAKRKSFVFDLWILLRTPYVVITRKGAM